MLKQIDDFTIAVVEGRTVSCDAVIPPLTLFHNLVPRPSHHPVFDCVQYTKRGRTERSRHVNDVTVYLDGLRRALGEKS